VVKPCKATVTRTGEVYKFCGPHTCKTLVSLESETEIPPPIPDWIQKYLKMEKKDFPPEDLIQRIEQQKQENEKKRLERKKKGNS